METLKALWFLYCNICGVLMFGWIWFAISCMMQMRKREREKKAWAEYQQRAYTQDTRNADKHFPYQMN